jgi:hypothetical protein
MSDSEEKILKNLRINLLTNHGFCVVCRNPRIADDPTGLVCGNTQCLSGGLSTLYEAIIKKVKELAEELAIEIEKEDEFEEEIKLNLFDLFTLIIEKIIKVSTGINSIAEALDIEPEEDPTETLNAIWRIIYLAKLK